MKYLKQFLITTLLMVVFQVIIRYFFMRATLREDAFTIVFGSALGSVLFILIVNYLQARARQKTNTEKTV